MIRFDALEEGWVVKRDASQGTHRAGGARCAVTTTGQVICSFVTSSGMGHNDFVPMIAHPDAGGISWGDPTPLWPHLADNWSILAPVSRAPNGDLLAFGSRSRIDEPGESFWSDETQGLKENELIWSRSTDNGQTWPDPKVIPMPTAGAAEAPNPMCATTAGRWLACYSPYGTFDPSVKADRSIFVVVYSDDQGDTWRHTEMMRFDAQAGTAMGAVTQSADGRLIGAGWHMHLHDEEDYPTPYALSDDGSNWASHRSTGIMGQSVSLTPLPKGGVLMPYNQRKHAEPGVWLALAEPTEADFGLKADQIVWRADAATKSNTSGDHSQWTDFSFGSPAVVLLDDDVLLLTFWVELPDARGVRYVRLKMHH